MPLRQTAITWTNVIRYTGMGGTGDQVVSGAAGWLFLTDELRYYEHRDVNAQRRMSWIKSVADRLAQDDVALVVAPIPDKARLYANQLGTQGPYPPYNQSRYGVFVRRLRELGLHVVDIEQVLNDQATAQDLYYKTDTHWNQAGASLAAHAVASDLATSGISGPVDAFRTTLSPDRQLRTGDLVRLMGIADAPSWLRPTDDLEAPATTAAAAEAQTMTLLGDTDVPITLVGTSFSLRGNFHGYLQQSIGLAVLNAAKDGSGFIQSITQYLNSETYTTARPRAIVWEIPERFLYPPTDADEKWVQELGLTERASQQ